MGQTPTNGRHGGREAPWVAPLRALHQALGRRDVPAATRAWEQAHIAALESLHWDGLIQAGDACLRIDELAGAGHAARTTARRAYFTALYRACQANSFDGILQAAEAFARLGDWQVVDECVGLAELLTETAEARERLRGFSATTLASRAADPRPAPA
jgi:hypothetical protein